MCAPTSIVASANNVLGTGFIQTLIMYNQLIGALVISAAITFWAVKASRIKSLLRPKLTLWRSSK